MSDAEQAQPQEAQEAPQEQEFSFLQELVDATGSSDREGSVNWLSSIISDAEKDNFRIEKKYTVVMINTVAMPDIGTAITFLMTLSNPCPHGS